MTVPSEIWYLPRMRPDLYVGSFPLHFERKLHRILGSPAKVLHPFGGLAEIGDRVDQNATTAPTWVGDGHDMHWIPDGTYDLVIVDPPYSTHESEWIYGTGKIRPKAAAQEAVRVCRPGGFVVLYHVLQPARPSGCELVRRIMVIGRVGHQARYCFVYRKVAAPGEETIQDALFTA